MKRRIGLKKGASALGLLVVLLTPAAVRAFCFSEAGEYYGISPNLLKAIAYVESRYDPEAVGVNANGSRDYGLMQVNSFWSDAFGRHWPSVIGDPCYNVMAGAWILRQCIERFGPVWEAVGCYHTGRIGGKTAEAYILKVQRTLKRVERTAWR